MRIIRKNAKKMEINPKKIGVLGFSAGGHLASSLSTHHDQGIKKSNLEIENRLQTRLFNLDISRCNNEISQCSHGIQKKFDR